MQQSEIIELDKRIHRKVVHKAYLDSFHPPWVGTVVVNAGVVFATHFFASSRTDHILSKTVKYDYKSSTESAQ